ncbi:MAG TPA: hypothetical protein DIW47_12775 [Bacteroidetes bacterium]|nr:hypothetical protein [Bacteroidota bacterium]
MNIKKLVFVLGMTGFPAFLFSQSGFAIGYNVGVFRSGHRNIQAYSQMYNLAAGSELKSEMKMTGFYRGIVLGWKMNTDKVLIGVRWSTKKAVSSEGENADGTERLRMRLNTYNLELAMGGEKIKAGFSLDAGGLRVQKKVTNKNSWEAFYDGNTILSSGSIATGITLFMDIQPGKYLEFRPFIQLPLGQVEILDKRTLRSYAHPIANFGFSLCFILPTDD